MVKIMNEKDLIMDVIEKIRPFLISDGGNIEFKDYKDDMVSSLLLKRWYLALKKLEMLINYSNHSILGILIYVLI